MFGTDFLKIILIFITTIRALVKKIGEQEFIEIMAENLF